jgi:ubiquinone/menaquinone biosynthesis C-methylase UbiE
MEWLLAGRKLQRCRTAFLRSIPAPKNILLLGEGNGRFLEEFLPLHPGVDCTLVDCSAKMLDCARARMNRRGMDLTRVHFVHTDALDWTPPPGEFDLVVTCFFLDCFTADQLARLIPGIAAAASPGARWLVADFRQPESGWARWRAAVILRSMYLFFQRVTRLPAVQLSPVDAVLERCGFALRERRLHDWGLLHSDVWQLISAPETVPAQA